MIPNDLIEKVKASLRGMSTVWKGKEAILEMKRMKYPHWKQMEWVGFYFQYLCDTRLSQIFEIPGPKFGKVEFDGFAEIPWDFKAHPVKNAQGKESTSIIINDREAIEKAIQKYGSVGLILGMGEATFNDQKRTFQLWHRRLKGGLSKYEEDRISREAPSRLRKTEFHLKEICIVFLDKNTIDGLGTFQKDFRNSDGSPRKEKLTLNTKKIPVFKKIIFS